MVILTKMVILTIFDQGKIILTILVGQMVKNWPFLSIFLTILADPPAPEGPVDCS